MFYLLWKTKSRKIKTKRVFSSYKMDINRESALDNKANMDNGNNDLRSDTNGDNNMAARGLSPLITTNCR